VLTPDTLPAIQDALADAGLDGWLLFDFRGINPVASGLLGLEGMITRRIFTFVPRDGRPTAITHAIEQRNWAHWPAEWGKEVYSSWRTLDEHLARLVKGKRVAMEYSPLDAVPYLDRVPAGVLEMVRAAGAEVVSSGELVSRFFATWTEEQLGSHLRAAEAIAGIARDTIRFVGEETCAGRPLTEYDVQRRILAAFDRLGLEADHAPNVSVGPHAADPHYEPTVDASAPIERGQILLIDLWARERTGGIYADQCWMASLGEPPAEARTVWDAVRDARDAAIAFLRERIRAGTAVRGAEVDDVARGVIDARGYGASFTHRTGHSIDARDLHGSGPHLDNLETQELRLLVPGVAFSIEPGVYLPGRFGVRAEVNAYVAPDDLIVTPREIQRELMVV
jgi:Xaa-Pro aminopeptidase